MTHDELLKAISSGETTRFKLAEALCAVVELHKPETNQYCTYCYGCEDAYPCPTIQAIEKELA